MKTFMTSATFTGLCWTMVGGGEMTAKHTNCAIDLPQLTMMSVLILVMGLLYRYWWSYYIGLRFELWEGELGNFFQKQFNFSRNQIRTTELVIAALSISWQRNCCVWQQWPKQYEILSCYIWLQCTSSQISSSNI